MGIGVGGGSADWNSDGEADDMRQIEGAVVTRSDQEEISGADGKQVRVILHLLRPGKHRTHWQRRAYNGDRASMCLAAFHNII